jgi:hypothetical protein
MEQKLAKRRRERLALFLAAGAPAALAERERALLTRRSVRDAEDTDAAAGAEHGRPDLAR